MQSVNLNQISEMTPFQNNSTLFLISQATIYLILGRGINQATIRGPFPSSTTNLYLKHSAVTHSLGASTT